MKIKVYIKIAVLAVFSVLTGCSKDYMNPTSTSNFSSEYVFSNSEDAKKAVLGVYAMFAQDSYTSRMSNVWMQNTDVEVSQPGAQPSGSRYDIWSLQSGLLTSFSDIKKAWDDNYLTIDRANQCIEGIKASKASSSADMKMLLGESYCLRAYRYFLLCNFWGDVPYFREAAKAGMALDVPKTDKNIIFSGMIQDLVDCEGDMYFADQYSDGIERMNREFALGMICRLSLFRAGYGMTKAGEMKRADDYLDLNKSDSTAVKYTIGGVTKVARTSAEFYQLAKDYAQKLIGLKDRELTDYSTVFMNENRWIKPVNSDVLYEVGFGNTNGGGDVGWCVGVTVKASSFGTTTIQVSYNPYYYFTFDPSDKRRDVCISRVYYNLSETDQAPSAITGLNVGKWNRILLKTAPGAASSKGTGINWPLMRYSDVLLMLAEAENQLNGPTDLAKSMLKRVRSRAFDASAQADKVVAYVDGLTSKTSFFDALVNERAWEFGGECMRRFDLVRWNLYGKKIVETKAALNNIGKAANDQELANPEVAKYANYAKNIYYAKNISGKVTFLNDYTEPTTDQVNSWASTYGTLNILKWAGNLYKKTTATDGTVTYSPADFTTYCWRGYLDPSGVAPVPYIIPISSQTVAASKYLRNEGYGLVLTSN